MSRTRKQQLDWVALTIITCFAFHFHFGKIVMGRSKSINRVRFYECNKNGCKFCTYHLPKVDNHHRIPRQHK